MRTLLIILCCFVSCACCAQPSDFFMLKKKNNTLRTYYAGSAIQFVTITGAYRDGVVDQIRNDTVFVREYQVREIPTTYGGIIRDTAGSFLYAYHWNQISAFDKRQGGFNVAGSGYVLMGGAALLTFGSGVVYLTDREKFSSELLIGSLALGGVGYLLSRVGSKGIVIGKRGYRIQYMDVTP